MNGLADYGIDPTCANADMSTIPQTGRSGSPVKPTSEVAHQPGQQPAAFGYDARCRPITSRGTTDRPKVERASESGPGSAVECSAERSRAHQRQGVAPAEGRAWETPVMRTV